ncbi:hypothetical protein [Dactylosporangium salmoneum]|uniref:Uncharacterized protein n=1 Tax=Dactylosporangium salmoneum TaxID=53361 RepID=A0ABP5SA90_9ACTN
MVKGAMVGTQETLDSAGVGMFAIADLVTAVDALMALERDSTACAAAMSRCRGAAHGDGDGMNLVAAIHADLDCADMAGVAHRVLSRGPAADITVIRAVLEAAAAAADRCVVECGRSPHAHCQVHTESARRAAGSARALLGGLPA